MVARHFEAGVAAVFGSLLIAGAAQAETTSYQVLLGDRVLGTLQYETTKGQPSRLLSALDNTPLSVSDGTYDASSRPVKTAAGAEALEYVGTTVSTRKNRVVSVLLGEGRALETKVQPEDDATKLSQVDRVPPGVLDPVAGFGQLAETDGCPEAFKIYDGRRVTEITPVSADEANGVLICHADYKVIAGPGHLSPFRFSSFDLIMTYDVSSGTETVLTEIGISTGMFKVRFRR